MDSSNHYSDMTSAVYRGLFIKKRISQNECLSLADILNVTLRFSISITVNLGRVLFNIILHVYFDM